MATSNPVKISRVPSTPGPDSSPIEQAAWQDKVGEVIGQLTRALMVIIGNASIDTASSLTGDLDDLYVRRDGGNSITGNIPPDSDLSRNLGNASAAFGTIYSSVLAGGVATPQATLASNDSATTAITVDSIGTPQATVYAPASNIWQAAAVVAKPLALEGVTQLNELATAGGNYAMGSNKLTGLAAGTASGDSLAHSLNPLNHLATATAAYGMAGNTFTNLGGCTSSNAALLEFVGNIADGASVVGINLRWNRGAAVAAGRYALRVQDNDASAARDLLNLGYTSTSQSVLWLNDRDGGGAPGITENLIISGDSNTYNTSGTVGFRLLPNNFSGAIWMYAGGNLALDIRNSTKTVSFGEVGTTWTFKNENVFAMQAGTRDVARGSYQLGFTDNTAPVSGRHFALYQGIPPVEGTTVAGLEFSVDYLGQVRAGLNARTTGTPTDALYGAHGWTEASTSNNQVGVDTYLIAGPGTGSSTSGGSLVFQTADAGASGTAIQSQTTKATIERDGDLAVKAGTSAGTIAKVGGAISYSTTQVGNTALTETDLFNYSVPANTLETNGDSLDFFAGGTFATSASVDKRVRAYFGATALFDTGALAITATNSWQLECHIIRSGAATQKSTCAFATSSTVLSASAAFSSPAETLSGAVTLRATGTGTNASDVVGELSKVLWSSAP